MRKQLTHARTDAARKLAVVLTAVSTILLAAAFVFLYAYEPPYKPPPFEPEANIGAPIPPDNMGYTELDAMGRFTFGIASNIYQQEDGSLKLYLTNKGDNEIYLMCEVIDIAKERTLYRSGLLRPGEYVESLYPIRKLKNEAVMVEICVYALSPEDYVSIGTITLDNVLQPF